MKPRVISAKFPDGHVQTRRTPRPYTHCWRAQWTYRSGTHGASVLPGPREEFGWALSEENAKKRMASWDKQLKASSDDFTFEIVEVVK